MKTSKKMMQLLSALFIFATFSSAHAQDEDPGRQTPVKRTKYKEAKTRDNFIFELDLNVGWDSNIFKTPSGTYIDPAVSPATAAKNDPQSGEVINPDLTFKYILYDTQKNYLDVSYNFDGEFYMGATNASNASGMDHKINLYIKNTALTGEKGDTLKKLYFKTNFYYTKHDYSYFHRGNGAKRLTVTSSTNEEDRYKRTEVGVKFTPELYFSTKTTLRLPIELFQRDYDEIGNLSSYDRSGTSLGVDVKQQLSKKWDIMARVTKDAVEYDTHRAFDATGSTVAGTIRKYEDFESRIGMAYDSERLFSELSYRTLRRDDLYANYWSYDQSKIVFDIGFNFSKESNLSLEVSSTIRDYDKETAPSGAIRTREILTYGLNYERVHRWGKMNYSVEQFSQTDDDKYYEYDKTLVMVGYNRQF